ncbi:MAG: efflux RND transporter periplasmic adaptor subunit, partial [bacterium]
MIAVIWTLAARSSRGSEMRSAATNASEQGEPPNAMPGMDMATPSAGSVRLTADQIRRFGVTLGSVEVRTLESRTRTVGIVAVDETRLAQMAPRFGGFVERLYVEATGQPVRRGQPLMDVYSPELVAAQQELLVARDLERSIGQTTVPGVSPSSPQ